MKWRILIGLRKGGASALAAAFLFLFFSCLSPARAAQEDRGRSAALYTEANRLFDEGDTDKAIEAIRGAIAAEPENAGFYDRLGYMLLRKGLADDALTAFNTALKLKPTLRTSKTGVGLCLLKKGDLKAAEEELTAALSLNPYPSMTHYALGLVYEKMNDYERAVSQFKEGIRTFKSGK